LCWLGQAIARAILFHTEYYAITTTMKKSFQIAIDGTVAAGKGTVSRIVAERLNLLYIDTGATYRCTALLALRSKIDPENEKEVLTELDKHQINMRMPNEDEKDGRLVTVLLDNEDVSWKIRTEEVSQTASIVAQLKGVRKKLVALQQQIAAANDVIMEGRDITHTVLPNAQLKIYLDADPIVRAKRRQEDLLGRGVDAQLADVLDELNARDERDSLKYLKKIPGVWEIDTTTLTINEVVELITAKAEQVKEKRI